jgi:hypothetical protein
VKINGIDWSWMAISYEVVNGIQRGFFDSVSSLAKWSKLLCHLEVVYFY